MTSIIFCLGAPLAGKSRLCQKLASLIDYNHISIGELLRNEVKNKTLIGLQVESIIKKGQLVPSEIVISLIKKYININQNLLIDGFPRNQENWNSFIKEFPNIKYKVILLDVNEKVMLERMVRRSQSENRNDDILEVFMKRLKIYKEETLPLSKSMDNIIIIDGNQDSETVLRRTIKFFL